MKVTKKKKIQEYAIKFYLPKIKYRFFADYKIIRQLKTQLNKFYRNKNANLRLILNHIITLNNLFHPHALRIILYSECNKELWPILTTFMTFLNLLPSSFVVEGNIIERDLIIDYNLLERLNQL